MNEQYAPSLGSGKRMPMACTDKTVITPVTSVLTGPLTMRFVSLSRVSSVLSVRFPAQKQSLVLVGGVQDKAKAPRTQGGTKP